MYQDDAVFVLGFFFFLVCQAESQLQACDVVLQIRNPESNSVALMKFDASYTIEHKMTFRITVTVDWTGLEAERP